MEKDILKINQKGKKNYKTPKPKTINRFWGLATRLEHRRINGKKRK